MRFEFNIATFLCLLSLGTFVVLAPACRDSGSAVVDHEHEDLVCPDGESVCVLEPDDEGVSRSACADLNTDNDHCGKCGDACDDEDSCVEGQCIPSEATDNCESDHVNCGDDETLLCVDLSTDFEHCGACDNACEPGMQRCYGGDCVPLCSRGYQTCGAGCCHWESYCGDEETAECTTVNCLIGSPCGNGCCDEDEYCGPGSICHDRCEEGQTVCDDSCCNAGQSCVDGQCKADEPPDDCSGDLVDCGDDETLLCVDLSTDFEHCGACDSACEPGMQRCYGGDCVPLCSRGYATCGAGCCHWDDFCQDEETAQCLTTNCLTGSPCGTGCCSEEEYCGPGSICHDRCDDGETVCGESCCTRDQTCTDGRCFATQ